MIQTALPTAPAEDHPGLPALLLLRLHFTAEDAGARPVPASIWRSAFGLHLRRRVCLTGAMDCEGCHLRDQCLYPQLMERRAATEHPLLADGSAAPNPYMLRPLATQAAQPGEIRLELTLFGPAIRQVREVIGALEAAAKGGLGRRRERWLLQNVERLDAGGKASPWASGDTQPMVPELPAVPDSIDVVLETPLQLRVDGHLLRPADFALRPFVAALLRRHSLLQMAFGDAEKLPASEAIDALLSQTETLQLENLQLHWQNRQRWSSHQQRRIPTGGLQGRFTLLGDLAALWPWLWSGQWLHLGKGTVMGQGCYRLQTPSRPSCTWLVSRHPGAVSFLESLGHHHDRQVPHLDLALVKPGDVVIGTLPVNLAAQVCQRGVRYLHLSLELPPALRGRELSAADLKRLGARLEEFRVESLQQSGND